MTGTKKSANFWNKGYIPPIHDLVDLSSFSDRSPQMPDKIDAASLLPTASDLDMLRRDYGALVSRLEQAQLN